MHSVVTENSIARKTMWRYITAQVTNSRSMKFILLLLIVTGIWFLASAATTEGLLPSGHGTGRISEIIEGLTLIGLGTVGLRNKSTQGQPGTDRA